MKRRSSKHFSVHLMREIPRSVSLSAPRMKNPGALSVLQATSQAAAVKLEQFKKQWMFNLTKTITLKTKGLEIADRGVGPEQEAFRFVVPRGGQLDEVASRVRNIGVRLDAHANVLDPVVVDAVAMLVDAALVEAIDQHPRSLDHARIRRPQDDEFRSDRFKAPNFLVVRPTGSTFHLKAVIDALTDNLTG